MKKHNCTVRDAKLPLNVNIKPEDVRGAVCRDHQKCVVAKALMRRMNATWVDVGATTVLIGRGKTKADRYLLSNKAKEQVRYFDTNNGQFAPCRVELKSPASKAGLGSRTGARARSGSSKRASKRATPTR